MHTLTHCALHDRTDLTVTANWLLAQDATLWKGLSELQTVDTDLSTVSCTGERSRIFALSCRFPLQLAFWHVWPGRTNPKQRIPAHWPTVWWIRPRKVVYLKVWWLGLTPFLEAQDAWNFYVFPSAFVILLFCSLGWQLGHLPCCELLNLEWLNQGERRQRLEVSKEQTGTHKNPTTHTKFNARVCLKCFICAQTLGKSSQPEGLSWGFSWGLSKEAARCILSTKPSTSIQERCGVDWSHACQPFAPIRLLPEANRIETDC